MGITSPLLKAAIGNLDSVANYLGKSYPEELYEKLRRPAHRVELNWSTALSDGKLHVFRAFVVNHNMALGPAKGGIRMMPDVTLEDVTGLAMDMTWKCSLIGVPFGGGKSGICADSRKYSAFDKELIIRSFALNAGRYFGPYKYIPAPDMGTNGADMVQIRDTLARAGDNCITKGCYVTGKTVICGGIGGRAEATGRGVAIAAQEALSAYGSSLEGAKVIVQGFGNVGQIGAFQLRERGAIIVGIADIDESIYDPKGLDLPKLAEYWSKNKFSIKGSGLGTVVDSKKILEMDCDLLVPAAAAGQITAENAGRIKAKFIVEGANGPTSVDGDEILEERGIKVVPDILANAGGVFVSYLEYTQEMQQEQFTEAYVNERLAERMSVRFREVFELSLAEKVSLRKAAMINAVKRVCLAESSRGLLL